MSLEIELTVVFFIIFFWCLKKVDKSAKNSVQNSYHEFYEREPRMIDSYAVIVAKWYDDESSQVHPVQQPATDIYIIVSPTITNHNNANDSRIQIDTEEDLPPSYEDLFKDISKSVKDSVSHAVGN